ncbi:AbiV family abortive infection protein [Sphingomonas sp. LY29]|uniref:AbiV family abortive infection protein n=1 Tax=Sphingomonas sp. LY29 TaxID=3095341 RepID=UPI002D766326|nr:AbiV family abortive infection protein [Sphingomonas sp. LY29]WRP25142.1 AbiV family abortive infection protein [Sphingomonas sp. LY29]
MDGIGAAQANAERLIEDARLLLEAGRYPSATALAILAMEERGKVIILRRLALSSDERALKEGWRDYRNHRAKNAGWIIPSLVADGARTMDALAAAVDKDGEHAIILDSLKQVAVYTDCLGNRNWSAPSEVIDADLAKTMLRTAEMMWGARPVLLREIELWAEVVGPEFGRPGMHAAVIRYKAMLHAEGLTSTHPTSLQAFMEGRPLEVREGD